MVMMVVMIVVAMPSVFFLFTTGLFQSLREIFIDPVHFLDRRPNITRQRPLALINQRFLPFAVFAGMFFVMVYPVLQQYFNLISISHAHILQAGCL